MFHLECKRAFRSPTFILSLMIGCAIVLWHFFAYVLPIADGMDPAFYAMDGKTEGKLYPHSLFNKWIGGDFVSMQPYLYFLILPVLAVLPHGASYFADVKSGYVKMLVTRTERRSYFASKALVTFLSGGTAVILPLILGFFMTATVLPALMPQAGTYLFPIFSTDLWGDLYYVSPYFYNVLYLGIIFIFSGLFATLSLVVSRLSSNRFLTLLFPFLVYIFIKAIADFFYVSEISPVMFLRPTQPADGYSLWGMFAEAVILFVLVVFFARKGRGEDIF